MQVYNPAETSKILNLRADRLGHMCYLDEILEAELKVSKTPLELCLSSNVITESVTGFPDHHFLPLFKAGTPPGCISLPPVAKPSLTKSTGHDISYRASFQRSISDISNLALLASAHLIQGSLL